jgi:hypothetical protein
MLSEMMCCVHDGDGSIFARVLVKKEMVHVSFMSTSKVRQRVPNWRTR